MSDEFLLDSNCCKHFSFRDLIECGETQRVVGITNVPKSQETVLALQLLGRHILDPLVETFGKPILTYGFCSFELSKKINAHIYPKADQHAGYERNSKGALICERGGAAVDFIYESDCMLRISNWLIENTPFDRLYFYGCNRPVHISYGPENSRAVFHMVPTESGRRIPRRISISSKALANISHQFCPNQSESGTEDAPLGSPRSV